MFIISKAKYLSQYLESETNVYLGYVSLIIYIETWKCIDIDNTRTFNDIFAHITRSLSAAATGRRIRQQVSAVVP